MLAIRPVTYEVETSLSPKRVLRKLDGDLIEHKPTINILSQSKFMKNHRDDTIFYGYRTDAESFQIFHHTAKKRDGGSTGFYGKVEKTPNGSRIYGKFRKPIYAYVVGVIWTVLVLFLTLMLVALGEKTGAVCFAAIWPWDCSSCSGTTRRSSSEPISTASRLPSAKQTKAMNNYYPYKHKEKEVM